MLVEDLQELGLTHGEAKAYLALLTLGTSTVGPVAKKSSISYSKIYEVLERLMEKGLASSIIKQKTRYYQAVAPERIKEYIDEQAAKAKANQEKLLTIMPRLTKMTGAAPDHEAEVFVGWRGMKTAYEQFMHGLPTEDTIDFFSPHHAVQSKAIDKFYGESMEIFQAKKYRWRGLLSFEQERDEFTTPVLETMEIRVAQETTPGTMDIASDRVLLTTWSPQPTAVLIRSKELASNFKEYFEIVWRRAKPHR